MTQATSTLIKQSIATIADYPKPGIMFRDVTTLMANADAFKATIDSFIAAYKDQGFTKIIGTESRGFIFGAPLALKLGIGFVPIRKAGKLPSDTVSEKYSLEYGEDELEMHIDAFHGKANAKVLLIDDLIATGGTAVAAAKLIERVGAECVEACFLISLEFLGGRKGLEEITPVYSVIELD